MVPCEVLTTSSILSLLKITYPYPYHPKTTQEGTLKQINRTTNMPFSSASRPDQTGTLALHAKSYPTARCSCSCCRACRRCRAGPLYSPQSSPSRSLPLPPAPCQTHHANEWVLNYPFSLGRNATSVPYTGRSPPIAATPTLSPSAPPPYSRCRTCS